MGMVKNRYGVEKMKPEEVALYNEQMSGIDRADQLISYYSSPEKTIRWYKKVIIFHLLDVAVQNSHYLWKKLGGKSSFREYIIKDLKWHF